mmetsp:Transcript_7304/g.27337  ORF Transcript_7304/g.27337 Transcript_7304/m.27337 type:complete len:331 (+) Transcript_7304:1821-2813(+)
MSEISIALLAAQLLIALLWLSVECGWHKWKCSHGGCIQLTANVNVNLVSYTRQWSCNVSHTDWLLEARRNSSRGNFSNLVAILVANWVVCSWSSLALIHGESHTNSIGALLKLFHNHLCSWEIALLTTSLSNGEFQSSFDWSDVFGHVLSHEAKPSLETQRVASTQSNWSDVMFQKLLCKSLCMFAWYRNFESVLSSVSTSRNVAMLESIHSDISLRHETQISQIVFDHALQNVHSLWSLKSKQRSLWKQLNAHIAPLFQLLVHVLQICISASSVHHHVQFVLIGTLGDDGIISDSSFLIGELSQTSISWLQIKDIPWNERLNIFVAIFS